MPAARRVRIGRRAAPPRRSRSWPRSPIVVVAAVGSVRRPASVVPPGSRRARGSRAGETRDAERGVARPARAPSGRSPGTFEVALETAYGGTAAAGHRRSRRPPPSARWRSSPTPPTPGRRWPAPGWTRRRAGARRRRRPRAAASCTPIPARSSPARTAARGSATPMPRARRSAAAERAGDRRRSARRVLLDRLARDGHALACAADPTRSRHRPRLDRVDAGRRAVLESLCRLYPRAPVFTLRYDRGAVSASSRRATCAPRSSIGWRARAAARARRLPHAAAAVSDGDRVAAASPTTT